jgi:Ca2+-binding RTX toxin-like protein
VGFGGEFNDKIVITSNVTKEVFLHGDSGDDIILAEGSGGGELSGGVGDDTITGGSGAEIIFGNEGNDSIDGAAGADLIFGDDGRISDRLIAVLIREKDGEDTISGGDGDDIIFGAGGKDTIGGDGVAADPDGAGTGNDLIFGDGGRIVFLRDTNGDGVLDTLSTPEIRSTDGLGGANDIINAHAGLDTVYGGAGDDTIDGGAGNDLLFGESGFDFIAGAGGADDIFGGTENDVIYGYRETVSFADPGFHLGLGTDDGADRIEGDVGYIDELGNIVPRVAAATTLSAATTATTPSWAGAALTSSSVILARIPSPAKATTTTSSAVRIRIRPSRAARATISCSATMVWWCLSTSARWISRPRSTGGGAMRSSAMIA